MLAETNLLISDGVTALITPSFGTNTENVIDKLVCPNS